MTDCGIYNEAEAMDKESEELVNTLMSISFVSKLLARKCVKQALDRQKTGETEPGCGSDPEAIKMRVSCMRERGAK